jgi:hypothetical protein
MSCVMLSSHLYLGFPSDLLVRGFQLNIFLTVLVSGILCTWPNQLSLWTLMWLIIFLCFISLSNSSLVLSHVYISYPNFSAVWTCIVYNFKYFSCLLFDQSFSKWFHVVLLYILLSNQSSKLLKLSISEPNHVWRSYANAQNINISRQDTATEPSLLILEVCRYAENSQRLAECNTWVLGCEKASLESIWKQIIWRMFETKVGKVRGESRKLRKDKLHSL